MKTKYSARRIEPMVTAFSDNLIERGEGFERASEQLSRLNGVQALQLLLAASRRIEATIGDNEIDDFAEFLGVFEVPK